MHQVDCLLGLGGRFDREDVVVFVLEVASLVRPQASQRGRYRRRLQADGGYVDEINGITHGTRAYVTGGARRRRRIR